MQKENLKRASILMAVIAGALALAQASAEAAGRELNRFGLSYRAGFNITVDFEDLGITVQNDPGAAIAGIDHNYDDGYNRVDISGNQNNQTWYWGYQNASQVPGDGFIYMHTVGQAPDPERNDIDDGPQHGAEVTYNREFGQLGRWFWGLEAAANYTAVDIGDNHSYVGAKLTTDRYSLGNVVPPEPPYFGTFQGPVPGDPFRPVISDIPTRIEELATVQSRQKLKADIFGFRLGPYFQLPLGKGFAASFSGGLALGIVDSEYSFQDTASGAGVGKNLDRKAKGTRDDFLVGGYAGGNLNYHFTPSISVSVGVQYQNIGTFSHTVQSRKAELDLSKSIFVTAGLGYSF